MTAILEVDRLCKIYDNGVTALKEVSFSVASGEFLVILGKSGSGKSTLMRCINRLVEPTSGKIILDSEEVTGTSARRLREIRKKIGMIFQQYNLIPRYSVQTNALMGCLGGTPSINSMLNHFSNNDEEKVHLILNRLGILEKGTVRSEKLSGGEQQRVGLARALMQEPELILADEPVSSLDPATSRQIMQLLVEFNKRDGVTILCNLHLPELAIEFGSRILALNEGQIIYDGHARKMDEKELAALY